MYDIDDLERRWKQYRRKRWLRRSLFLGVGLLLVLLPLLFTGGWLPLPEMPAPEPNTMIQKSQDRPAPSSIGKEPPPVVAAEKPLLTEEKPLEPIVRTQPAKQPVEKKKPKMLITFTETAGDGRGKKGAEEEQRKSMELDTVKNANLSVVREIEKRFPLGRDYDDAIYLAKYYYGKRNYKKAESWALQANTVDSTRLESWILFAKAKAKRGHRKEALRVLQSYYDRTGNAEVKALIDRIRTGKRY